LAHYARHFNTVELNNAFYRLPAAATLQQWRDAVPAGFAFAVKASRYITHQKKLKDPQQTVPTLLERLSALGDKLGPILFQLPPNWAFDAERLRAFTAALPAGYWYAFEFRDRRWFNAQTYAILRDAGMALCIYDWEGNPSPQALTAEFAYLRLHGPTQAYQGCYSHQALAAWAAALQRWAQPAYCYFNNDTGGGAPQDARQLQTLVGKAASA